MFTKLKNLFASSPVALTAEEKFYRDWDDARARATSPSERSEIDAIFGRASIH